jgi:hypothetical protein
VVERKGERPRLRIQKVSAATEPGPAPLADSEPDQAVGLDGLLTAGRPEAASAPPGPARETEREAG